MNKFEDILHVHRSTGFYILDVVNAGNRHLATSAGWNASGFCLIVHRSLFDGSISGNNRATSQPNPVANQTPPGVSSDLAPPLFT